MKDERFGGDCCGVISFGFITILVLYVMGTTLVFVFLWFIKAQYGI